MQIVPKIIKRPYFFLTKKEKKDSQKFILKVKII